MPRRPSAWRACPLASMLMHAVNAWQRPRQQHAQPVLIASQAAHRTHTRATAVAEHSRTRDMNAQQFLSGARDIESW
jgi:hypothetical protein